MISEPPGQNPSPSTRPNQADIQGPQGPAERVRFAVGVTGETVVGSIQAGPEGRESIQAVSREVSPEPTEAEDDQVTDLSGVRLAAATRMGARRRRGAAGKFLTLEQLLDDYKRDQRRRGTRLALAISGGGPRGAWEGGAVEAIIGACRRKGIHIDIIAGASVGSINALLTFVDTLSPPPGPVNGIFACRQSAFWKEVTANNQAASRVLDKPWIIDIATHKTEPPILNISGIRKHLDRAWDNARHDLKDLFDACNRLAQAAGDPPQDLTPETADQLRTIQQVIDTLGGDSATLDRAWRALHFKDLLADPGKFRREVQAVGAAAASILGDLAQLDVLVSTLPLVLVADAIIDVIEYLGPVIEALAEVAIALGKLVVETTGEFIGALLELEQIIQQIVLLLLVIEPIVEITVAVLLTTNHVFERGLLRREIGRFVSAALSPQGFSRIIDAWRHHPGPTPALYMAATDLTTSRLTVFGLDQRPVLDQVASAGLPVVDLAGTQPSRLVYVPAGNMLEDDPVITACLTSGSLPVAFAPVVWSLLRDAANPGTPPRPQSVEQIEHVLVDGGVIDNSPIDLAVLAGATHIISLELNPLLDLIEAPTHDTPPSTVAEVLWDCFNASMDGGLQHSIDILIEENGRLPAKDRVAVYRIAPLVPRDARSSEGDNVEVSPALFNFDGVYNSHYGLVMSMYDWFAQGYIDAKDLGPTQEQDARQFDPVIADYFATTGFGYVQKPWWGGDRYWRTNGEPLPDKATLSAAMTVPSYQQLADDAAARRGQG
jgi:predicted acylesterase/phospholipase RssA